MLLKFHYFQPTFHNYVLMRFIQIIHLVTDLQQFFCSSNVCWTKNNPNIFINSFLTFQILLME